MAPSGKPIAANALNTVTLTPVALGTLRVVGFDLDAHEKPFEIALVPVAGAYVICLPATLQSTLPGLLPPPRLGRTNDQGLVVEREEGDLHDAGPCDNGVQPQPVFDFDPAPSQSCDELLLDTAESYDLYWGYDRATAERAYSALKADPGRAIETMEHKRLVVRKAIASTDAERLELLTPELRRKVALHLLGDADQGYVEPPSRALWAAVFDVTPPTLRTLHLCDFLQWYTVNVVRTGMEHWKVLKRVANIADIAAHGAPDADLDPILKSHAKEGSRERAVLEHYRDYAWQCAKHGVRRGTFIRTLQLRVNTPSGDNTAWESSVRDTFQASNEGAVHPATRAGSRDQDRYLSQLQESTLVDYFDMYTFGAELNRRFVSRTIAKGLDAITQANARTTELVRRLFAERARHDRFLIELERSTPADAESRKETLLTYVDVAARVRYLFWEPMSAYAPEDWAALEPYTKWMGALGGGAAELLKNFFGKHIEAYELDLKQANDALTTFYRYHLTSTQQTQAKSFHLSIPQAKSQVKIDLEEQTIAVLTEKRTRHFRFTRPAPSMPSEQMQRPHGYVARAPGNFFRRASGAPIQLEVEVPVDLEGLRARGRELPAALTSLASALNVSAGLLAAKTKLADGEITAWLDLGQNCLVMFESSVSLHVALGGMPGTSASSPLLRLASAAGRTVAVVDGIRNALTGYQVLYGDDSPIADELERGGVFRAAVVATKGCLQFTTGVTGAAYGAGQLLVFGGAEATGLLMAAAGPIGIALVCGGLVIASMELYLAATTKFAERTEAIRAAWKQAERTEKCNEQGDSRTVARIDALHQLAARMT